MKKTKILGALLLLACSVAATAYAATCEFWETRSDGSILHVKVEGDVCVASTETGRCQCS